jgi:large subunit ribosomal protein L17
MRHGNKNNALGRKKAHRDALLSNLAISLIDHKRIETTLAKARALRRYVFSYLQNKEATAALFRDVAPKVASRPGGYTRIIKLGNRLGDAAEMAMIELVDFNTTYTKEKSAGTEAKKTRRSRRSGTKTASKAAPKADAAPEVGEAAAE